MALDITHARILLADAVARGDFPGAQLAVSLGEGGVEALAVGALSYDPGAAPARDDTRYDLASLTKPVTALAALRLSLAGALDLDAPVSRWVPEARGSPLGDRSLDALLSHRAGLPGWLPLYAEVSAGEPEAAWEVALRRVIEAPLGPEGTAVYSDLGYIIAGLCVSRAGGGSLSEVMLREVLGPLGVGDAVAFRATGEGAHDPTVAPTERCPWRGRVLQGEVHDENCWALGGTAGHAGLFGAATDLARIGRGLLGALKGRGAWLDGTAARAMVAPREGGSHRLGWDGKSAEGSSAGTLMHPSAFGHLGFTGTSLWCDPVADVAVALVTNRVHPTRENTAIRALRPALHDAVMAGL